MRRLEKETYFANSGVASMRQEGQLPPLVLGDIKINDKLSNSHVFFVNSHVNLLSSEAFYSPRCSKYRLAAGLRPDPLGDPNPIAGLRGLTSKGRQRRERG